MKLFSKAKSPVVPGSGFMDQVQELINTGRERQAYEMLSQAIQQKNCQQEWLETHWSLAKRSGDRELGFYSAGKLLRIYIAKSDVRRAYICWHDCLHQFGKRFPLMAEIKLIEVLMAQSMLEEASHVTMTAFEHISPSEPPLHIKKLVAYAARCAPAILLEKVNEILRLPQLTAVEQHAIQAAANKAMRVVNTTQNEAAVVVNVNDEEDDPESRFDTSYVKLETVVAWGLNISFGGERKLISYDQIKEIVIVGIKPPGGQSYLVLDLFLDDRSVMRTERQVIRIDSTKLNPMRLVPGARNPLEGFFAIARDIYKSSPRANMVPSGELSAQSLPVFRSISEYESSIDG